ncbi:MAG: phosphatase PAP2 family protein [Clostridia bacterium]|nr:phosphatase PAP2 family protein [Clostridia bacterium]
MKPCIDYSKFKLSKLNTIEYKHLKLLIFWPIYGVLFYALERFIIAPYYYPVYCGIDDIIPFNEWFIIPYLFWYVFLIGMHIYTLIYDVENFKKMMRFIIITYTAALIIYAVFPNCQQLRPPVFERENLLTKMMSFLYTIDTNTNVCPSIHVIGSLAVLSTALRLKGIKSVSAIWFVVTAFFISISTVFLKQHSIIDIFAALPICILADLICWGWKNNKKERVK